MAACMCSAAHAQSPERPEPTDRPVEAVFKASRLIQLPTTRNYDPETWNFTILHSFSPVDGGVTELWGLDGGANIRFGLDYGFTKRYSAGIGRSRNNKLYDIRARYVLLSQLSSGRIPVSVTYAATASVNTSRLPFVRAYGFTDRLSYAHMLVISRKMNDNTSLQLVPTVLHVNRQVELDEDNTSIYVAAGGRHKLNRRTAVIWEASVDAKARPGMFNIGLEKETGGHVFQFFLTSTDGLNDTASLLRAHQAEERFSFRQLRLGFNVHRIFW